MLSIIQSEERFIYVWLWVYLTKKKFNPIINYDLSKNMRNGYLCFIDLIDTWMKLNTQKNGKWCNFVHSVFESAGAENYRNICVNIMFMYTDEISNIEIYFNRIVND